jgi:feruloyl esterase
MLPGVYHCGGGPAPDKIDLLTSLMGWVEDGAAPGPIDASLKIYGKTARKAQIKPEME